MGLRIFLHSIKLVFAQFGHALQISALLYIVSLILGGIGLYYQAQAIASGGPNAVAWQLFLAAFLSTLPSLWIAVAWHRFVLLDEMPSGPLPTLRADKIWSYFGRGMQLFLVLMVVVLLAALVAVLVAIVFQGAPLAMILVSLLPILVAFPIFYRLAPIFPGAAIGQAVGIRAAWNATKGSTGAVILLAVISAIATVAIDLPTLLFAPSLGGQIAAFAWYGVTAWIKLLVGVSIMTTIYGVYVEKRLIT